MEWSRLVEVLLGAKARALSDQMCGPGSFQEGAIWSNGLCLTLAASLGKVLKKDVVLVQEEDNEWCHAAVLTSPTTTLDWEQGGESPEQLLDSWPTAVKTKVISVEAAVKLLDPVEKALVASLVELFIESGLVKRQGVGRRARKKKEKEITAVDMFRGAGIRPSR
jgi:hypothetical protein